MTLRSLIRSAAAAVALLLCLVSLAAASPQQVLADYDDNGQIDGSYSLRDLTEALALAHGTRGPAYGDIASAISEAQDEVIADITPAGSTGTKTPDDAISSLTPHPPDNAGEGPKAAKRASEVPDDSLGPAAPTPGDLALPTPPTPQPGARVPWPFVVLSALAVLLALAGAGAGIYRRRDGS